MSVTYEIIKLSRIIFDGVVFRDDLSLLFHRVSYVDRECYRSMLMSLVVASDVVSQRQVYRVLAMSHFYHLVN
jgi:hypothetical protein